MQQIQCLDIIWILIKMEEKEEEEEEEEEERKPLR